MEVWLHAYDPLGSPLLSTAVATLPLVVLLGLLAVAGWSAHAAAASGLATAMAIAVLVFGMPGDAAVAAAIHGAALGLFPIGWIIVAAMFLYRLCVEAGALEVMKRSVTGLSADHRLQALLIAFSFGAFLEGAAGYGAPVAISAALLAGAGFPAVEAGWRGLVEVWPAVLVCGASFATVQFAMANFVGAALVDVVGGVVSLLVLATFLRCWKPATIWRHDGGEAPAEPPTAIFDPFHRVAWAWAIWWHTLHGLRGPLVTIAAMLALAFVTRYSGTDVTLGLAMTRTGAAYPFFAALLVWLQAGPLRSMVP